MTAQELIRQNDKLTTERSNFDSLWQEIANYMVPHKRNIVTQSAPGTKQTTYIYDSTAIDASQDLAAWLHSSLTSMSMEWFSLRFGAYNVDKDAEIWLEDCKQKQFDALRASNFEKEIISCYLDLVTFCTAGLFSDEAPRNRAGFGGFVFHSLVPGKYAIAEASDGNINALFRTFDLGAADANSKWKGKVGEKISGAAEKEPMKQFPFLHAVYPSEWFGGKSKEVKPFISVYVDLTHKKKVQEGGYYDFPFHVARWVKGSGEMYGRGPGFTALPDVKTLNTAARLGLKAWGKAIDPPMTALDGGVIGSVKLTPGGITFVSKHDVLRPIESGAKWEVGQIKTEDLRRSVRAIFKVDQIRLLPPPEDKRQMTAYEVAQKLLGPTFGYVTNELLDPLIERTFNMMYRSGAFLQPPESVRMLIEGSGEHINVQYEGPLARAQRSHKIEATQKTMIYLKPIAELKPEVLDNFDFDEMTRGISSLSGIPPKWMLDKKKIDQQRKMKAELIEKDRKIQELQGMVDIASKAGQAINQATPETVNAAALTAGALGIEGQP